jgi:NADPH-dependent 2,4-dienoyl-CoA reductase/sulfur reductase-like enzyme
VVEVAAAVVSTGAEEASAGFEQTSRFESPKVIASNIKKETIKDTQGETIMEKYDALIIGGSAAGVPAVMTARRHYPDARLAVVRQEEKVSVPCGIPYIFGTLGSPDKNLIPDQAVTGSGADLIVDEVKAIDREAHTVTTAKGRTLGYDKLVLATGSLPIVPPIPGSDLENVFSVKKDVDYLKMLSNRLDGVEDVVIIGGGFIGMEMADECRKRENVRVQVVELLPHCLFLAFDQDLCIRAEEALVNAGVGVHTNARAEAIVGNGKAEYVELDTGEKLKADMVIFGIGAHPNTALAREAGLELGPTGAIAVDRHMQTNDPDIFSVGDCAEKVSFFTGKPSPLRLASIATAEARIAGANLFESRRENPGAIGVFSTKINGLAMGIAGIGEKAASEARIDYVLGQAEAVDKHPGSMPGAQNLRVKLIFRKYSGVLIGGQVCCGDTTGEFVNLIAALIQARMHADQIAMFQMGTHPALTASPIAYQLVNAAEQALIRMR